MGGKPRVVDPELNMGMGWPAICACALPVRWVKALDVLRGVDAVLDVVPGDGVAEGGAEEEQEVDAEPEGGGSAFEGEGGFEFFGDVMAEAIAKARFPGAAIDPRQRFQPVEV